MPDHRAAKQLGVLSDQRTRSLRIPAVSARIRTGLRRLDGDDVAHARILAGAGDRSLSRRTPYRDPMASNVEIRSVRPDEYTVAGEVTAASYREFDPRGAPDWQAYLRRIADVAGRAGHTVVLVAVVDGEIAGTATLEIDRHIESGWKEELAPDEAHLRMLGVHPSHRREGIGRSLVEATIDLARTRGKARLTLETTPEMRAAHAMYAEMGFTPTGRREVAPSLCFDSYELQLGSPSEVR